MTDTDPIAVLAPLTQTIEEIVRNTPIRLGPGGTDQLAADLTVRTAVWIGKNVLPRTKGMAAFVNEVDAERQRQLAKWGDQHHPDGTGWQRFGATAQHWKDVCDEANENGTIAWAQILLEEVFEACEEDDPARLRTELVQSAAVIQAWIADIDSRPAVEKVPTAEPTHEGSDPSHGGLTTHCGTREQYSGPDCGAREA
jgi:hypothetical protein